MNKTFSERLRECIVTAGLTQGEAARLIGCSSGALTRWLKMNRYPRPKMLHHIEEVFHVSHEYFTEGVIAENARMSASSKAAYAAGRYIQSVAPLIGAEFDKYDNMEIDIVLQHGDDPVVTIKHTDTVHIEDRAETAHESDSEALQSV